jgi:DNA-binding winged helix-turn-helix (wHTH) protein
VTEKAHTVLYFADCALDAANGRLWRGGAVINLRPKSLAVLAYLASRPGQLVQKDALLAAVWPGTAVTEWVLTSCVKELRQALGDASRQSRMIETVHRRGYRFIAEVEERPGAAAVPPVAARRDRSATHTGIVGREAEIAELRLWLNDALAQRRQVGFLAGEPGIGKTALIDAFVASLGGDGAELLIARGQCVDQHGAGEPYLPVLEALGRLCKGPQGSQLVALLRRHAPAWLLQLPGLLDSDEAEALERRLGAGSRQRMLREMAAFIEALTQPLVLLLEDLHWSDRATVHLLATLAQRRDPVRLLLIGTYRPVEVAVRDHPLKTILQELRMHGHCRDVWLQPLGTAAVAEYLRARWRDLAEVEALAHIVHQHTDGNPLFLVNVANALAADGVITETASGCVWRDDIAKLGLGVPHGLRQMIAAQNDRLSGRERDMLAAGSVIGRTFSAALVAAALETDVLVVEEHLARLAQRGQVVQAAGESAWPDATVAGAYRFAHALYQTVLREHLPPTLRRRLHGRIADRLEAAYGTRHADLAAELAFHYEAAGQSERAVPYIEAAADHALRLGAGCEAVTLLQHGVALLDALPPTPVHTQHVTQLCIRLGRALPAVQGYTQPEVELAYERARALSEQTDDRPSLIQSLAGLATVYVARAKFDHAARAAAGVTALKEVMPLPVFEFASAFFNGLVRYHTGPLVQARAHLDAAAAIDTTALPAFSIDPRVAVLGYLSMTLLHQGYPDQARARMREAAARAAAGGRPFDRANILQMECVLAMLLRDHSTLATAAADAVAVGTDHDLPVAVAVGTVGCGLCVVHGGDPERGRAMMRTGIETYRTGGHVVALPFLLGSLAGALAHSEDLDAALLPIAEARALVESTREQRVEAELHRLEGVIRVRRGEDAAAERGIRRAVELARQQGARWWELRATTSLARLGLGKGQPASVRRAGRAALARIADSFTEGGDTADLQEARRLLADLQQ